jgi:hypothetical protein
MSCLLYCSLHRLFLSLDNDLTTASFAVSLVFLCLLISYLLCLSLHHSFLSLADILPTMLFTVSIVSFSSPYIARCAVHCMTISFSYRYYIRYTTSYVVRSFLLPTSEPSHQLLYRLFLSPANITLASPLTIFLVFLTGQPLAHSATRLITHFFLSPTSHPLHRSLYRLFFSLVTLLLTAPLTESLVPFSF